MAEDPDKRISHAEKSRRRERSNYHRGSKNEKCYFCESRGPLQEHHVIPQRFGGLNRPENIVELCQLCHKRIERLYDKSFYEWFGIEDEKGSREFHRQCEYYECENMAKVKVDLAQASVTPQSSTALYCRPCAASKVNEVYQRMLRLYHSEAGINMEKPDADRLFKNAIIKEADDGLSITGSDKAGLEVDDD